MHPVRHTTIGLVTVALVVSAPVAAFATSKVKAQLVGVPTTVANGSSLTLTGKVSNGKGRTVEFEHRTGGRWLLDGKRTVPKNGGVSLTYPTLVTGPHSFRLYVKRNHGHPAVVSRTATVTVLAPVPPPSLTLTFPTSAIENNAIPFTYSTTALPIGGTLVLQREMGTASAWGTVLTLDPTLTTSSAPALPLGAYTLRLAALSSTGKLLATTAAPPLKVYGTVSLGVLIGRTSVSTVVAGGHSFNYVTSGADSNQVVTTTASPCRSIHLDLARAQYNDSGIVEQATIVQQSADPTSTTVATNSIASLDAALVPGQSWALNIHPTGGFSDSPVYINGSASCYATTLVASG